MGERDQVSHVVRFRLAGEHRECLLAGDHRCRRWKTGYRVPGTRWTEYLTFPASVLRVRKTASSVFMTEATTVASGGGVGSTTGL